MKVTKLLRKLMEERGVIVKPNCYDPLTARIAEKLGFKAIGLGGWVLGAHLCTTEPLTTLTETVSAASYITKAIKIPLIVDANAGFGEPVHTVRTVEEFERVGVAAIHIEDQIYPKRAHYHRDYREHITSMEEMIEKIKYACEARDNPDFVIIARTDAFRTDGFDEAVKRGKAYVKAGADAVMAFPNNLEEAKAFPSRINAPTVYVNSQGNRVGRPILSVQQAEEMGYKFLSDATITILVAAKAVKEALTKYLIRGRSELDQNIMRAERKEVEDVIGLPRYYRIEEETTERNRVN